MQLRTIRKLNLKNRKVLLRVDFNCPIRLIKSSPKSENFSSTNRSIRRSSVQQNEGGVHYIILDDSRITAVLPTIKYLIAKKAKVILISHLGDPIFKNSKSKTLNPKQIPNSKLQIIKKQYSLQPVYKYLRNLGLKIKFADDCLGEKTRKAVEKMNAGEILLLENLRFYSGEKENDKKFAKGLAGLADLYINDAFAVSHRAHASVSAITRFLPSYAGFLLEKELKALSEILERPRHPLVVLIGGAKISTKIKVIENLAKRPARRSLGGGGADKILLAGGLANTFFAGQNYQVSDSLYEKEMIQVARQLMGRFKKKIVLPIDVKVKQKIKNQKSKTQIKNVKINKLKKITEGNFEILDIGEETVKLFSKYLKSAKMIVWNGPMGLFEEKPFDEGTKKIAKAILANRRAKIIIGGGETIASLWEAISNFKFQISKPNLFVSTGGGAMLEFLEGKILPGIKPLLK